MQFVVIGAGPDGQSKVVEVHDVEAEMTVRTPGVFVNRVWTTEHEPPELPVARRRADETPLDIGLGPAGVRWTIFRFDPDVSDALHRTDTLDYDLVLAGEVTLGLDEGEVRLRPGDSVMIPGVAHRWIAGPDGCTVSVVMRGLPPVD
jgi:quercetin dioxygenase-like cupin family protein